jgi:maleate isomerase
MWPTPHTTRPARLGMIVPSSNTVVETVTPYLLPQDRSIIVHVSRLRVTHVAADDATELQFQLSATLAAASLLADAGVDLILWNGTAASWLGFERDKALTEAIRRETGIPALTAVTAINDRLGELGVRRLGLVTPYVAELEKEIIENYRLLGIEIVASRRLDLTVNTEFAAVPTSTISAMVEEVSRASPDAIVIMCTNLAGALIAHELTAHFGIPVLDSVAVAISATIAHLA